MDWWAQQEAPVPFPTMLTYAQWRQQDTTPPRPISPLAHAGLAFQLCFGDCCGVTSNFQKELIQLHKCNAHSLYTLSRTASSIPGVCGGVILDLRCDLYLPGLNGPSVLIGSLGKYCGRHDHCVFPLLVAFLRCQEQ